MDLENQFEDMDVSGEEEEGLPVESTGEAAEGGRVDLCLVGRFITNKTINSTAMQTKMSEVWKPMAGVHIRDAVGGRFLFQFFHFIDVKRVLEGGPWTFDNSPLLLARMEERALPSQVPLVDLDIWVRIFDIPIGYFSEKTRRLMGDFIGKFLEYDAKNNLSI